MDISMSTEGCPAMERGGRMVCIALICFSHHCFMSFLSVDRLHKKTIIYKLCDYTASNG